MKKRDIKTCAYLLNSLSLAFYFDDPKIANHANALISGYELLFTFSEFTTLINNINP